MTSGRPGEPREQRRRLGVELRKARKLAGLSQADMASRLGISQKHVSRLELGAADTTRPQVTEWARASGVTAPGRQELLTLTVAAVDEAQQLLREKTAGGLAPIQEAIRQREAGSRVIRNFQLGLIPGLLQLPDYARLVFALADPEADLDAAVLVRLARQQALHDEGRQFEFVMTEAALRWRPGSAAMLAAQLQHVAAMAALASVALRVIPSTAEMHALPRCGFVIHEDYEGQGPVVFVETPHTELREADPANVEIYRQEMERFRQSALSGDDAIAFVREVAASLAV